MSPVEALSVPCLPGNGLEDMHGKGFQRKRMDDTRKRPSAKAGGAVRDRHTIMTVSREGDAAVSRRDVFSD